MNRPPFFALLVVLVAAASSAEPLSRAQAVARALERNPTVLRSFADRSGLRGRAKQARADALPEVSVYGAFLRYQDPGFFDSPNIDEFPPEILQAFRPIASNLWDGYGTVRQTLWSFSLGKAIRAAGYAEHLGDENVRTARQDVALRAIFAYNAYLLALEQVGVRRRSSTRRTSSSRWRRTAASPASRPSSRSCASRWTSPTSARPCCAFGERPTSPSGT